MKLLRAVIELMKAYRKYRKVSREAECMNRKDKVKKWQ